MVEGRSVHSVGRAEGISPPSACSNRTRKFRRPNSLTQLRLLGHVQPEAVPAGRATSNQDINEATKATACKLVKACHASASSRAV